MRSGTEQTDLCLTWHVRFSPPRASRGPNRGSTRGLSQWIGRRLASLATEIYPW